MLDAHLAQEANSSMPLTKNQLLYGLLDGNDLVELVRYSDTGPTSGVSPIKWPSEYSSEDVFLGWAVAREQDNALHQWSVVWSSEPERRTMSGVMGNAPQIAAGDHQSGVYNELPPDEAAQRRHGDELAAQVASQALRADLFVTDRPYLQTDRSQNLHADLTVGTPSEALALLGLYLRTQGDFHVFPDLTFNRGLFFWVGTRELLPQGWRWFSAVVSHDAGGNDHSLTYLAQSALQRVARALEARDAVHVALNQPQNNDTRDDALSNLDVVLLYLMGALDVTARVAHRVLRIELPEHRAGWQRNEWLAQVKERNPPFAAVVSDGTEGASALTILRRLRNQIHGEALQGIAFQTSRMQESLIALPSDAAEDVLEATDTLGGHDAWGLRSVLPETIHIDPGVLVEQLFPVVLQLLNNLMEQTPVESLVASEKELSTGPPEQDRDGRLSDPFKPKIMSSIRWLLGF
jgi:hypothetical protein